MSGLSQQRINPELWTDFEYAPNTGKLYATPADAAAVLVVDPATNETDSVNLGVPDPEGENKWFGCSYATVTGKLYGAPRSSATVLVIDPVTNTTDSRAFGTFDSSALYGSASRFSGMRYVASTAKLYATPANATGVLILDPVENTSALIPVAAPPAGDKWFAAFAFVPTTGKLYVPPHNSNMMLVVDPATNATSTLPIPGVQAGNGSFFGAQYLPSDGRLYACPGTASSVLIFDPVSNATDMTTLSSAPTFRWYGFALVPMTNALYAPPLNPGPLLVVGRSIARVVLTPFRQIPTLSTRLSVLNASLSTATTQLQSARSRAPPQEALLSAVRSEVSSAEANISFADATLASAANDVSSIAEDTEATLVPALEGLCAIPTCASGTSTRGGAECVADCPTGAPPPAPSQ